MQKRFSQMSKEELMLEAERLRAEGEKLQKEGNLSLANITKQRYYFCLSYLMNPEEIMIGSTYYVMDEDQEFVVEYLNGVMAWGYFPNQPGRERVAFPIAQLKPSKNYCASSGCGCTH